MNKEFTDWVEALMRQQNPPWKPADLARAVRMSDAAISRILNGERSPSDRTCVKIATVFNQSPQKALRLAGKLPKAFDDRQEGKDLLEILEPDEYDVVLDYIRWRLQKQQRRKNE